jgi:carbon monoxide dehydrogenase subunit G
MKRDPKETNLAFKGSHIIELSRELLWNALNDPEILQKCIRGCDAVERVNETEFSAVFGLRIGPLKKSFKAKLTVENSDPPSRYQLQSRLSAGMAGSIAGVANVVLEEKHQTRTEIKYEAEVIALGWLSELGIRVLSSTAEKYMHQFFQTLVSVLEPERNDSGVVI